MSFKQRVLISLLIALPLGALLSALFPVGSYWIGWLDAALLLAVAVFCLLTAWQWAGAGKRLAWMVALALLLRLGLGAAFSLGLPVFGYPEPEQKAGYLFYDAFRRDNEAWSLVNSGQPLLQSLTQKFSSDQYGGLLILSGLIYRVFSPDAHRPILILILAAFTAALGVPFFYRAVSKRWGAAVAALAAWIVILYPDSLLLGASQMREPFLLGLTCIAFWGVVAWGDDSRRGPAAALAVSLVVMALFSYRVALPLAGVLAVWLFLDHYYDQVSRRGKMLVWAGFALIALIGLAFTWQWFASSVKWDVLLQTKVSGFSEKAIQQIGDVFRPLFYTVYGLARPLLPAAIGASAEMRTPWIWKAVDLFRATGWYLLVPLVLYSLIAVRQARMGAERRTLIWFALAVVGWMVISSARAGGDQWDNPRYRTIFLPWLAVLASWSLHWAWQHRDAWLLRMVVVEGIFLGFFTQWYMARYWGWLQWKRLTFWQYPIWIVGLSVLVLVGGWVWDRWRMRKSFA